MHVLLSGGAGFIGHHLTKHFLLCGKKVTIIDDFSTGRRENIELFIKNNNFTCVEGNARDPKVMEPLIADASVVYNLAASVGVQKIFLDPIECIENNTEIGATVLKLCAKFSRRLFMFSTSEIYGKTQTFPFAESADIVLGPCDKLRWSYACSKVLDDYLARAYFEKRALPVTIVRLFNTIGPNQVGHYGMVVPRFMSQATSGAPLSVYGSGNQTRCFTDVRDVVRALDTLIDNRESLGELINIGTADEISMLDLAKKIIALTGSRSEIKMIPYQEAYGEGFEDMDRRVASAEKLKTISNFRFAHNLDESLSCIYNSLQKQAPSTNAIETSANTVDYI